MALVFIKISSLMARFEKMEHINTIIVQNYKIDRLKHMCNESKQTNQTTVCLNHNPIGK